jgi:hypothetical protein
MVLDQCGKEERDGEKKVGWLREIGPKELRRYRKWFLIPRIYDLNKILSNSNKFYSEPNSRSHVNTCINASRHECNNQL